MKGITKGGHVPTTGVVNNLTKRVEDHARKMFAESRKRGGGCSSYDNLVLGGQRKWRRRAARDMMDKGIYE